MEYPCPTDAQLAAMTDEQILGPRNPTIDDLAGRFPIMLPEVEVDEELATLIEFDGVEASDLECYIDLERRTVVHCPSCTCIILSSVDHAPQA